MAKSKSKNTGYPVPISDSEWRAKQDLQTILEAERIKRDPARMKLVRKCAEKCKEELVADLGAFSEIEEAE